MNAKVMILYPAKDDLQSVMLYEELIKQGMEVLYLPFRCDDEDNGSSGFYLADDDICYLGHSLKKLRAVFIRALAFSVPANLPAYLSRSEYAFWRAKFMQENLRFASLFGLLNILRDQGVLIINHPDSYYLHNTKSQFFSYLSAQGFSVPELIATNDYNAAAAFCTESESVCKSAFGVGATRGVLDESLHAACGLKQSPAIFQKKVRGETVRVHTVGTRVVLSLKILSATLDSRSSTEGFTVIELPDAAAAEIIAINLEFQIHYSAWDVLIADDGQHYLLDCNPGPYIGWIGNYFSRFVMSALARFIRLCNESTTIKEASQLLQLPELRFKQVRVNHSGQDFDYSPTYQRGLRIRH